MNQAQLRLDNCLAGSGETASQRGALECEDGLSGALLNYRSDLIRSIALCVLCSVHSCVGRIQQSVLGIPILGTQCNASARRTANRVRIDVKKVFETATDSVRNLLHIGAASRIGNQGHKLIAANPREDIHRTELSLHSQSDLLQIFVPDFVAVPIVDALEVVQVTDDQAYRLAGDL